MSAIRDAASVIVVRDSDDGWQMLLTRRPDSMRFMGGRWVFPGGAVDASDPDIECTLDETEAHRRIGEDDLDPRTALGLHVAAVRELFEEVGILLARDSNGEMADGATVREKYVPIRHQALTDFSAFLKSHDLTPATDVLRPHGRLITPAMSEIRFDARFFVVELPRGQSVIADPGEVTDVLWASPAEVLRRVREEAMAVPLPTMAIVQGLVRHATLSELFSVDGSAPTILSMDVSPSISCVLAPNPGLMTGPGTNTWLVGRDGCLIVDPAVDDEAYLNAVMDKAERHGPVVGIALTHWHPDHVGGAQELAARLGCQVYAHADANWPGALLVQEGSTISCGEVSATVRYTPGHARGHICLHIESEATLIVGDVVAGIGTVVISPPDGNMADYLSTLRRLLTLDVQRILPGHGPVIESPSTVLNHYISHRLMREEAVLKAVEAGADSLAAIVEDAYDDLDPALRPVAEQSVRAHLEKLVAETRTPDRLWE